MSSFLPEGTIIEEPSSQFVNPSKMEEDKQYRYRALDSAITGIENWVDKKPKRYRIGEELPVDEVDPDRLPKTFWAFCVWDYQDKSIKTLELTQKTLMKQLKKYIDDEDYGDPLSWDFVLSRTGQGMETEYSLLAKPPKPIEAKIAADFQQLKESGGYDIEKLFAGEYPLGGGKKPTTGESDGKVEASKDEENLLESLPF